MSMTAIVTGANRGIGLEIARQLAQRGLTVVLTARDAAKGEAAAQRLRAELGLGDEVLSHPLDVADERSVQTLRAWSDAELGQVDVLVNNAGILPDRDKTALTISSALMREVLETNTLGPLWLCQAFMPGMLERNYGRIVNVASESAQLKNQHGRWPAYNLSKLALNALTLQFAGLTSKKDVLVNSVHPGWVQSDMGGPTAPRTLAQGADTATWLATLPAGGPNGQFFFDRRPMDW